MRNGSDDAAAKRFAQMPSTGGASLFERGSRSVRFTVSWQRRALVTAVAAMAVLTACSGRSSKSDTTRGAGTGAVPEPAKPVTVTFASWVGNEPTMKKLAADFHQEHPNITVKFQEVPAEEAADKLTVQVANNTAPDV